MATVGQIKAGIGDYIQNKIMPMMDSRRKFALGIAYGLVAAKAEDMIAQISQTPAMRITGIIMDNGEIDLDTLYRAALEQMRAQKKLSIEMPIFGEFTFAENDLMDIYQAIKGRAEG